jgi:hypothetical protein
VVIEDLKPGWFTGRATTVGKLLDKIPLPLPQAPYFIIQRAIDFGFRKLPNAYRLIDPLIIEK